MVDTMGRPYPSNEHPMNDPFSKEPSVGNDPTRSFSVALKQHDENPFRFGAVNEVTAVTFNVVKTRLAAVHCTERVGQKPVLPGA